MACLDFVASDFGGFYRYAAANAALAAPRPGEARVVFFGDSITDNWSKAGLRRLLPGQALREPRHRRPDDRADAPAVPRRRDRAAAEGRGDPGGDERHRRQRRTRDASTQIQDNLASMAELAQAHGIKVVLASLLPVSDDKKDANGAALTRTARGRPATIQALNAGSPSTRRRTATRTSTTSRPWRTRAASSAPSSTTTACTRTRAATRSWPRSPRRRSRGRCARPR